MTAEMYYEDEGRSYDKVIRKDLTITDEEIDAVIKNVVEKVGEAYKAKLRD